MNQIVGYNQVKQRLCDQLSYPVRYADLYKKLNIKPIKGIILNGPPGTGKTTLSKAMADKFNHNFIFVSSTDILNKYVGQTEQNIEDLFEKARATQPCILFIDQIDALFNDTNRESINPTGPFLSQMDGVTQGDENVVIIGTTNKIDRLSRAMLRAGRFELVLTMDYPTTDQLKQLYSYYFKEFHIVGSLLTVLQVSKKHKLTGSDIAAIKRLCMNQLIKNKEVKDIRLLMENLTITNNQILQGIKTFLKNNKNKEQAINHAF